MARLADVDPFELLDRLTECVAAYDLEGRFIYANAATAQLFGRPRAELLGQRPWDLMYTPPTTPFREALDAVLRGGAGRTITSHYRVFQRWFEIEVHPFHQGALVVTRDISERQRLQDQLIQSQRLEAIGRLAGGIAHDFNNLLTIILGSAEMLLAKASLTDVIRIGVTDIIGAAERASLVTRQLLAFGRAQRLAPGLVDLSAQVEGMERLLRRVLGEDIDVVMDLRRPLGLVRVDAGQIEQVVLNLVVNAREAMPRGGRLEVKTATANERPGIANGLAHDGPEAPHEYVVLAVSDTGVGMPEEVRARIFEPFFTTKELGRGSGLGLATVHGIVEQSGGHIEVRSEPGAGSTFAVYLPRVQGVADETPASVRAPPGRYSGTETVLLVEDDDGVRKYVREALQQAHYTVLDARNGGEALLILEQHAGPVHLLLTDIILPRMTGIQLASRLRAIQPAIRVVFMSGYAEDRILDQGGLDMREALVTKPIRSQELLRAVRTVLDRVASRPPPEMVAKTVE